MPGYVSHLEGAIDGTSLPADRLQTIHEGRPIWVRYDLDRIRAEVSRDVLLARPWSMWRYRELLPLDDSDEPVTLGENVSPLLPCPRLAEHANLKHVSIKDESQLPTGSFKARGQALAITMARKFGVTRVAIPTNGNAGGAMAAYAARAGMEAFIFMPDDTPAINQYECAVTGAKTYLVNGYITDCGRIVREGIDTMKWFDISTLREPYRIEGKKTMGLELAEQLGWKLPDVILYPTGGGTGLIGMWKAFQELRALGWLESETMPRMVAVQSDGCCPIVTAFDKGQRFAEPHANAHTVASGIRVPAALGDFMILDAVRESGGKAVKVPENRLPNAMREAIAMEGISICPETAACIVALNDMTEDGSIKKDDHVVIFNTGAVQKYPEAMKAAIPRLNKDKTIDYTTL